MPSLAMQSIHPIPKPSAETHDAPYPSVPFVYAKNSTQMENAGNDILRLDDILPMNPGRKEILIHRQAECKMSEW